MERINVTKTFLPPIEEYEKYLKLIWDRDWITNQGPLLLEFEKQMRGYLSVDNFHFVANGTFALQLALRGLDITSGEVITTPFSYVASTSAILWEHCKPVFVDINPETLCIDADKIEAAITQKTKAILAVHVFGNPCDTDKIEAIAKKHGLKVIYDGAHAFGAQYKDKSLLSSGDITICSFHATKLFHTVEGGALIVKDKEVSEKIEVMKRFGHTGDEHFMLGTNAKASEFHAAMGLCNLKYVDENIKKRKRVSERYDELLGNNFDRPKLPKETKYNYAYYPVIIENEDKLLRLVEKLQQQNIFPRRYFYPSLNTLPYIKDKQACPVSEDIADRILCLPLYADLEPKMITKICEVIIS